MPDVDTGASHHIAHVMNENRHRVETIPKRRMRTGHLPSHGALVQNLGTSAAADTVAMRPVLQIPRNPLVWHPSVL